MLVGASMRTGGRSISFGFGPCFDINAWETLRQQNVKTQKVRLYCRRS
jgi:uncharacterized ParB-like nuclease family protein